MVSLCLNIIGCNVASLCKGSSVLHFNSSVSSLPQFSYLYHLTVCFILISTSISPTFSFTPPQMNLLPHWPISSLHLYFGLSKETESNTCMWERTCEICLWTSWVSSLDITFSPSTLFTCKFHYFNFLHSRVKFYCVYLSRFHCLLIHWWTSAWVPFPSSYE